MSAKFENQVAVVTGGSTGIGFAILRLYLMRVHGEFM